MHTYKRIAVEFFWEEMSHDIKKYVDQRVVCQRNKVQVLFSVGLL